ncbi:unnamed protein product [Staurois parvus]|uniref:Uncharacterized protein n=1 Tax=Staurois parvus TaxID=386267 RepID=A0ABN9BTG4_9NEOB|nr:unnamed protein product [Staurois parvus]
MSYTRSLHLLGALAGTKSCGYLMLLICGLQAHGIYRRRAFAIECRGRYTRRSI